MKQETWLKGLGCLKNLDSVSTLSERLVCELNSACMVAKYYEWLGGINYSGLIVRPSRNIVLRLVNDGEQSSFGKRGLLYFRRGCNRFDKFPDFIPRVTSVSLSSRLKVVITS